MLKASIKPTAVFVVDSEEDANGPRILVAHDANGALREYMNKYEVQAGDEVTIHVVSQSVPVTIVEVEQPGDE